MGKPLVRFCEGPGHNEWHRNNGTGQVVVACDEAFTESLVYVFDFHVHLESPVYSKGSSLRRGYDAHGLQDRTTHMNHTEEPLCIVPILSST